MGSNMAASHPHQCPGEPPSLLLLASGPSANALAWRQAAGSSIARDADGQKRVIAPVSREQTKLERALQTGASLIEEAQRRRGATLDPRE